jgi:myo-inositol-1(or 4)-monophosphatase
MSDLLDFAQLLARTAGEILRQRYSQPREIHAKGWRDLYTDADVAAQEAIVQLIKQRDSRAAILAEEGLTPPPDARRVWVIDPLDGTSNYVCHLPAFSTSIALVEDGQPLAGVIYDPLRDNLFAAEVDRGVQLNGQPIRVSSTHEIAEGIVGLDWGRGEEARTAALTWLHKAGTQCRTIRAVGSSALSLSYLAAGWLDVYYHGELYPWDGAAGQVIAQEAGAKLFNFKRQKWHYREATCLACNPQLVDWALASLG